jgi:hypothetical protein
VANAQYIYYRLVGVNMFLNWMKLPLYLNWIPQFSLLFRTFNHAMKPIAAFIVVFFIVFIGFAFSHAILFNMEVYEFRDLWASSLNLFRMLMGDLDGEALFLSDPIMGPIIYCLFVCFCVLVVFNILISILMDSYSEAMEELKELQKTEELDLFRSFTFYLQSGAILRHLTGFWAARYELEDKQARLIQTWWKTLIVQLKETRALEGVGVGSKEDLESRVEELQKQLTELAQIMTSNNNSADQ